MLFRSVHLVADLQRVAAVDEQHRAVQQHDRGARRTGEARQPGEALLAGRQVFVLVAVGAGRLTSLNFSAGTRPATGTVAVTTTTQPQAVLVPITNGTVVPDNVLFEGAQGTLLDLDHGTYPFVTSSSPIAAGAAVSFGIGPNRIDEILGVSKAYVTRVGEGPFPSEIEGAAQEQVRQLGGEFGTVTGRERRCGWLDLPALRFAVRVNGITSQIGRAHV